MSAIDLVIKGAQLPDGKLQIFAFKANQSLMLLAHIEANQ